jgi:hypothetical protein
VHRYVHDFEVRPGQLGLNDEAILPLDDVDRRGSSRGRRPLRGPRPADEAANISSNGRFISLIWS